MAAINMGKAMLEKRIDSPVSEPSQHLEQQTTMETVSERKLLRKIDLNLLPILCILYLCSFIDRINIGNARIQGLEKDLHMGGNDYNVALFVFFLFYILLEVPCNMLLKNIKPSIWLPGIMLGWGIITVCQGVTQSYAGLVVCRLFLGAFEAGFVPGAIYLISMYYKRLELQWRVNIFFSASILSGAFSGLLAYGVAHMDGIANMGGWRWIFITEGLFTVVVAVAAFFILPDWPETASFLTVSEREQLLHRLAVDAGPSNSDHWDKRTARLVFGDPKIYLGVLMYLGIVNTGYSTSFFTPTILSQLGWTSVKAQVMSIPIYIVATCITLTIAFLSDYLQHRYLFTILGCLIATIGYTLLLLSTSHHHIPIGARYFALYAITTGAYITQPVTIAWLNNNLSGHYKRGIGAALQIGLGNCGGLVASNIYLKSQAPTYPLGFGLSLALVWLCGLACTAFWAVLVRENRIRQRGGRDGRLTGLTEMEQAGLGDEHPRFRFTY